MALYSNQDGDLDDGWLASINTTPLVDVMLVLLIIFLITIPVVSASVNVNLPCQYVASKREYRLSCTLKSKENKEQSNGR